MPSTELRIFVLFVGQKLGIFQAHRGKLLGKTMAFFGGDEESLGKLR